MAAGIYGCKNDCGNVRLKNGRRECTAVKIAAEMYGCKNDCGKRMVLMKGADEENI